MEVSFLSKDYFHREIDFLHRLISYILICAVVYLIAVFCLLLAINFLSSHKKFHAFYENKMRRTLHLRTVPRVNETLSNCVCEPMDSSSLETECQLLGYFVVVFMCIYRVFMDGRGMFSVHSASFARGAGCRWRAMAHLCWLNKL